MLYDFKLPRMLTKRQLFLGFLVVFVLLLPTAAQARGLSSSESSLLTTMNAARKSHGLPALRVDVHLVRAARGHSADMMRRQYFAHGSVAARAVAAGAPGPPLREGPARAARPTAPRGGKPWVGRPGPPAGFLRARGRGGGGGPPLRA